MELFVDMQAAPKVDSCTGRPSSHACWQMCKLGICFPRNRQNSVIVFYTRSCNCTGHDFCTKKQILALCDCRVHSVLHAISHV